MLFPIGTKINGQILREHLTLFPKANHRSVEELILNRKFSLIEKTLEKHCKNIARVIINYSISLRKIYQKDERVLFLKINISQNILRYFTFTCRAKKVHRSKKKKKTHSHRPSILKFGKKNREESREGSTMRNIIRRKKSRRKIERRQRMDKRMDQDYTRIFVNAIQERRVSFRFGRSLPIANRLRAF